MADNISAAPLAEDFGVQGCGKFYESAGTLRDVVQNHLFQIVALLDMELPTTRTMAPCTPRNTRCSPGHTPAGVRRPGARPVRRLPRRAGRGAGFRCRDLLRRAAVHRFGALVGDALVPARRQVPGRDSGRGVGDAVRPQMGRRTGPAQLEDHHRHGRVELPDAPDEREAVVGASAGLQRDPTSDGLGRLQCRCGPAQPELQAHSAALDGVGGARGLCDEGQPAAVHAERPMQGRPSAWSHRTTNAKTTPKTIPLVEDAACPRAPPCSKARPRVGDKVSAIPAKPTHEVVAEETCSIPRKVGPAQRSSEENWLETEAQLQHAGSGLPQTTMRNSARTTRTFAHINTVQRFGLGDSAGKPKWLVAEPRSCPTLNGVQT